MADRSERGISRDRLLAPLPPLADLQPRYPPVLPHRQRLHAAMVRAHSRASALSVTPGNSRRSSTAVPIVERLN
jgi:hypothetical protein